MTTQYAPFPSSMTTAQLAEIHKHADFQSLQARGDVVAILVNVTDLQNKDLQLVSSGSSIEEPLTLNQVVVGASPTQRATVHGSSSWGALGAATGAFISIVGAAAMNFFQSHGVEWFVIVPAIGAVTTGLGSAGAHLLYKKFFLKKMLPTSTK